MIRGTTAPFIFSVPADFGEINKIQAIFWQKGNPGTTTAPLPVTKWYHVHDENEDDGFNFAPNNTSPEHVSVVLTPEETLRFSDEIKASAQIKIYHDGLSSGSTTYASKPQKFTVYPIQDTTPLEEPGEYIESDGIRHIDAGII